MCILRCNLLLLTAYTGRAVARLSSLLVRPPRRPDRRRQEHPTSLRAYTRTPICIRRDRDGPPVHRSAAVPCFDSHVQLRLQLQYIPLSVHEQSGPGARLNAWSTSSRRPDWSPPRTGTEQDETMTMMASTVKKIEFDLDATIRGTAVLYAMPCFDLIPVCMFMSYVCDTRAGWLNGRPLPT